MRKILPILCSAIVAFNINWASVEVFAENEVATIEVHRTMLVPLGKPFGLKILTKGAIVTDFGIVNTYSPAKKAGIKAGDIIINVDNKKITSTDDIETILCSSTNAAVDITFLRQNEEQTVNAVPEVSAKDGKKKLGMWTRDSCAGIGTLSFYNPETGIFKALGHSVCDKDTGVILPISNGEIVPVDINSVVKGCGGKPGELCGSFISKHAAGNIESNTKTGLSGTFTESAFPVATKPLPMAFMHEVEVGKATILSTINGTNPQMFDIIIEKLDSGSNVKNMVIKVTDKALIEKTGGIVQGMSGSPIIQNGRVVGAVTHVFVSDSTRGYGIFAEKMNQN